MMKVSDILEDAVVYETPQYTLVITCADDLLEESVVYQDIFQKGKQQGVQQGVQQGLQHERHLVLRQLERLLGKLPAKVQKQVDRLDFEQLAALGQALFDFTSEKELAAWLKSQTVNR